MTSLNDIKDTFAFLDGWEDRYKFLIEIGNGLRPLSDDERCEATRVRGCASQVWLVFDRRDHDGIFFRGDSDAHLVRGLVALMIALFSGKSAREVLATDAEGLFTDLDLADHITAQRANGLASMVRRIKAVAEEALAGKAGT